MNQLQLNSRWLFLRFPFAVILFYFGQKKYLHKKLLKRAFVWSKFKNQSLKDFEKYWKEIENKEYIPHKLNDKKLAGNAFHSTFGKWMYIVIRATKPEIFIETGVAQGYSSWLILNALNKNNTGHLYSIDLPSNDTNDDYNFNKEQIGHVVPEILRKKWTLILGDVKQELPKLSENLPQIDIFFHDSDHSYEHMKFEFEFAKTILNMKGIILSDDIHKNKAFSEFVEKNKYFSCVFTKGGMIKLE